MLSQNILITLLVGNFGKRKGETGRRGRTQVLLLELAGEVALDERGFAWWVWERVVGCGVSVGYAIQVKFACVANGRARSRGAADRPILKAPGFSVPSIDRPCPSQGGVCARTGTAVTDEDQLERGRGHVSFPRFGGGRLVNCSTAVCVIADSGCQEWPKAKSTR